MTIEEKAKAYDEAIKRAKGVIEQNPLMEYLKKGIEYIFPELKESEDEKIRKALIDFFYRGAENGAQTNGVCDKDILAWLEKQGEQKPQGKSALEAINEEKVDNANKVKTKFQRIIAEQEFGLRSYSPRIRNILMPNGVDPDKTIADMIAEQFYKLLLIFSHNENIK